MKRLTTILLAFFGSQERRISRVEDNLEDLSEGLTFDVVNLISSFVDLREQVDNDMQKIATVIAAMKLDVTKLLQELNESTAMCELHNNKPEANAEIRRRIEASIFTAEQALKLLDA